jgi:hypothetical protein
MMSGWSLCKVKVKLSLCVNKYGGGTVPHILNPRTRWRWVVSYTPRPLYSHRMKPVRTSQSDCMRWRRINPALTLPALKPGRTARSVVTTLTELPRLGKQEYSERNCPSATSSTTNLILTIQVLNPHLSCKKRAWDMPRPMSRAQILKNSVF